MGLLSASASITQYRVEGRLDDPVMETVRKGLRQYAVDDIDNAAEDRVVGWTSFEAPFEPDFSGSGFVIGTHFVFSLRIDKKSIPSKVFQKHYRIEAARRLAASGREFLSRSEKKEIKEHVTQVLQMRIPATPNVYDVVWNYEENRLWFLTNLKAANEALETQFTRSFRLGLVRLFPFTHCEYLCGLSDAQRDVVSKLRPTRWEA